VGEGLHKGVVSRRSVEGKERGAVIAGQPVVTAVVINGAGGEVSKVGDVLHSTWLFIWAEADLATVSVCVTSVVLC
jgi:hypothetical protein